jgi:hypothetical protein
MIGSGSQVEKIWTLSVVVIPSRRLYTTYRSHLQGSRKYLLTFEQRYRSVVPKRRYEITTIHCVIVQKSADLTIFKQYKLYPLTNSLRVFALPIHF